ncbi:hypothetical protein [Tropicibacter sp. Alg240-R139]|uniref:hypothetical protein n=1 Tax=Tropicibacter sp. Alg240-R139 TaxID=2305991 RepID=UPI0013DF9E7F|nr:hypothetical protein [Tropicibacter sp. Alg240-R139]
MDWVEPVCDYVMQRLPKDERGGFNDQSMTAWQFGCMLLVACGYAQKRPWGAVVSSTSQLLERLPIAEDAAVAVLAVAGHRNEVSWRQMDGASAPRRPIQAAGAMWTVVASDPPKDLPPTVAARGLFGSVRFSEELQEVLELLGFVRKGTWTEQAHPLLLRKQPSSWRMTVPEEEVFQAALQTCLETMPPDVEEAIAAIAQSAPEVWINRRVEALCTQHKKRAVEAKGFGVELKNPDTEKMRHDLLVGWPGLQVHEVERLFYARWRLSLGWDPKGVSLLPLFHDRLANQMVQAILREVS